jgi:hypothetical protein
LISYVVVWTYATFGVCCFCAYQMNWKFGDCLLYGVCGVLGIGLIHLFIHSFVIRRRKQVPFSIVTMYVGVFAASVCATLYIGGWDGDVIILTTIFIHIWLWGRQDYKR